MPVIDDITVGFQDCVLECNRVVVGFDNLAGCVDLGGISWPCIVAGVSFLTMGGFPYRTFISSMPRGFRHCVEPFLFVCTVVIWLLSFYTCGLRVFKKKFCCL